MNCLCQLSTAHQETLSRVSSTYSVEIKNAAHVRGFWPLIIPINPSSYFSMVCMMLIDLYEAIPHPF